MTTQNQDGSVTNTAIAITPTQALAQLEGCKAALVRHLGGGGYMSADLLGKKLDALIECAKLYQLSKDVTFLNEDEIDLDKQADDRYNEMRDTY